MEDYKSPWELLGIEEGADKREIRKAYARALKTVRPDEDPEAFQKMREARDSALWELQFQGDFVTVTPLGEGDQDSIDHVVISEDVPISQDKVTEDEPQQEKQEDKEKPLEAPKTENKAQSPEQGAHDGDKNLDNVESVVPETENAAASEDLFAEQVDLEKMRDALDSMFGAWGNPWALEQWQSFLSEMTLMGRYDREDLEYEIIALFDKHPDTYQRNLASKENRLGRKKVFALLNEEFGWLENDQMVYGSLPYDKADKFTAVVRQSIVKQSDSTARFATGRPAETKRNKNSKIPDLDLDELRAFVNDTSVDEDAKPKHIVNYYAEAQAEGAWPSSFNFIAFILTYFWTAWYGQLKPTVILLVLSLIGWVSLPLMGDYPALVMVVLFSLMGTHILAAQYASIWRLRQADAAARLADKEGLVEANERESFMHNIGKKRMWWWLIPVALLSVGIKQVPKSVVKELESQEIAKKELRLAQCPDHKAKCILSVCAKEAKTTYTCLVEMCPKEDKACVSKALEAFAKSSKDLREKATQGLETFEDSKALQLRAAYCPKATPQCIMKVCNILGISIGADCARKLCAEKDFNCRIKIILMSPTPLNLKKDNNDKPK